MEFACCSSVAATATRSLRRSSIGSSSEKTSDGSCARGKQPPATARAALELMFLPAAVYSNRNWSMLFAQLQIDGDTTPEVVIPQRSIIGRSFKSGGTSDRGLP